MQVKDAMTRDITLASPDQTIRHAANLMAQIDVGILPVGEDNQLIGMITDRDITIRAVAMGKSPDTPIRDIMTEGVKYCFEDDEIEDVADNMAALRVRRLAVINHAKRLVGILSLSDIAMTEGPDAVGIAICGITENVGQPQISRSH